MATPKPITSGPPFTPDLQSWIRNEPLAPDWLRVGTDIVGAGAFNASFTLSGSSSVADDSSSARLLSLALVSLIGFGMVRRESMA